MVGMTVTLWERHQKLEYAEESTPGEDPVGVPVFDAFGDPVWEYAPVTVANVLVGQPTTEEITSSIDLYGKKIEFMLGIPKGDVHDWEDAKVEFFGRSFRTFGAVIQGIEANIPTPWHKKVRVAKYE